MNLISKLSKIILRYFYMKDNMGMREGDAEIVMGVWPRLKQPFGEYLALKTV